ncbi:hypothetical protein T439DRAFT_356098 [Meredithblackwellia eburnea MCA 4105]
MGTVHKDAAPAIIFLILYAIYFIWITFCYATKRFSWKSRYSFVYFHVILRLAGQSCGIVFSVMSWDNFNKRLGVLVAYLVLSAEGYFSLVLCAYRFLIVWQNDRLGNSNIEPRIPKGTPFWERMRILRRSPMGFVHWSLIGANTVIITGGSYLSNALSKDDPKPSAITTGKILRCVGTGVFLALVQVFFAFGIQSYRKKADRTLVAIMATWPFLTVRGVYGIISIVMKEYSYYNPEVYTSDGGMSAKFLTGEYVLATTMEWCSCGLLLLTYFGRAMGGEHMREDHEKKALATTTGPGEGDEEKVVTRDGEETIAERGQESPNANKAERQV